MKRVVFIALTLFLSSNLNAAYIFKNGTFYNVKDLATKSVDEHFTLGLDALKEKNFEEAQSQFRIVAINFPDSSWTEEAYYFLAVCYYHLGDKDLANQNFSEYLKLSSNPKYFDEVFQYKLAIADAFKDGEKRHLFNTETLPRWVPDTDIAYALYDEIIVSLASSNLAATAHMHKAALLETECRFRESIENLQQVIRKFPKSEFSESAYQKIADVYLIQAKEDPHNPDILALSQINLKRFSQEFPKSEKIGLMEEKIAEMKELFADALYDVAKLYERKKEPKAAILYYHAVLSTYPDTEVSKQCRTRFDELTKEFSDYVDEITTTS